MSTEKKLTAMQEVISELNDCLKLSENDFITQSLKLTIHICKDKLQKEKQQFIEAGNWGSLYSDSNKTIEQYYEETFKK